VVLNKNKTGRIKSNPSVFLLVLLFNTAGVKQREDDAMKLVEQLEEYYRLSRREEVQNRWCRLWLPQGEARIAYLRELLEPTAKLTEGNRRPAQ
jgi:hypothetical protein